MNINILSPSLCVRVSKPLASRMSGWVLEGNLPPLFVRLSRRIFKSPARWITTNERKRTCRFNNTPQTLPRSGGQLITKAHHNARMVGKWAKGSISAQLKKKTSFNNAHFKVYLRTEYSNAHFASPFSPKHNTMQHKPHIPPAPEDLRSNYIFCSLISAKHFIHLSI